MRYLLAAYDPAHYSSQGSYWSWHHPDLPLPSLDHLYQDILASSRPNDLDNLSLGDLRGGFVATGDMHCFWYRFMNGGYDTRGRPGRFVLVVAACDRTGADGWDTSAILDCPIITQLAARAPRECPLQCPQDLAVQIDAFQARADPVYLARLHRGENLGLEGPDSWNKATALCGHLPHDRTSHCVFRRDRDKTSANFSIVNKAQRGSGPPLAATEKQAASSQQTVSLNDASPERRDRFSGQLKTGVLLLATFGGGVITGFGLGYHSGSHVTFESSSSKPERADESGRYDDVNAEAPRARGHLSPTHRATASTASEGTQSTLQSSARTRLQGSDVSKSEKPTSNKARQNQSADSSSSPD